MNSPTNLLQIKPEDIRIIEQSLRNQAALESRLNGQGESQFLRATAPKTEQILDLLNRIRSQI